MTDGQQIETVERAQQPPPQPQDEFEDHEIAAIASLHNDLITVIKGTFKTLPDRWDACAEAVQVEAVDRAALAVDRAVRQAVRLLVGEERAAIDVDIESVKFGEKIQIQLIAGKGSKFRHDIADAAKSEGALLVLPAYPSRQPSSSRRDPEPPKPDATGDLFEGGSPTVAGDPPTTGSEVAPPDPAMTSDTHDAQGNGSDGEPRFE